MIWFFVSSFGWLGLALFKKSYWFLFLLILVFLSSFRYYVGSDYDDYVILFELASLGISVPVEFSFSYISYYLSSIGLNFQGVFVFYSLLTFLFVYKGLREISKDHEFLGVSIFLVYAVFYFPSLSIVRQALAISIAFYGCYRFLHKGMVVKYFFTVAVASFFHFSAVVFLVLVLLNWRGLSIRNYLIILFSFLVFGLYGTSGLISAISDFTGLGYKSYSFDPIRINNPVFYIFTFILFLVFILGLKLSKKEDFFIVNVIFFVILLRLASIDYSPVNRIAASFSIFVPIFIYQIFYSRFNFKSKLLFLMALIPVVFVGDFFRATKDYSYFQYSLNVCLFGEPCPISIFGDLPLEKLLIREELR